MEMLRRKLKIFWLEHKDLILFLTLIIVGTIAVVQWLNQLAIQVNAEEEIKNTTVNSITKEENIENEEVINEFIEYCENKQLEKAYKLLSEECKKDTYPTIEDFNNKYYKKMFEQKYDIEVEYKEKNIYKIIFYEDILSAGSVENRKSITHYYKIEQEEVNKKIYINF